MDIGKQPLWEVDLDVQYRDGWYVVALVPLVDGKPRVVPFGYRTSYELLQYVPTHVGIEDEEITSLASTPTHPNYVLADVSRHSDCRG